MAASELNKRLDYLTSYSSQLVFVCSDKIQQQSQVVESFLAHQHEQTDLALVTANELTPLVTYRETLFRQLVSQSQEADFNRPLNQLLAPLNEHSGAILVWVFHGEKLPNKLVKELWELVLQSRFANNKQHLNVLLIGLSDWAESAKSGLAAKSKEQPIVLNSQSDIQYPATDEFSELESFIQDKRKKFALHRKKRHDQSSVSQPIYKKWWVATLFGLAFLAIFAEMLSWQYPEKVRAIMSYISAQISTQEQYSDPAPTDTLPSGTVELVESASTQNIQPTAQPHEELADPKNAPNAKILDPKEVGVKVVSTKKVGVTEVGTKDILVTDWSTASAKLEEQSHKVLLQTPNLDGQAKIHAQSEQPVLVKKLAALADTVNDYQIEDKVEFEVSEAKATVKAIAKPTSEQPRLELGKVEPVQTSHALYPEPDVLLALPAENFVIQIAAMANISILQYYVRDNQLGQQLWLYKTQRYGADWYVLLKNQHFPSIEDARAEITNLADVMFRDTPFVKSIGQVKQEISVSRP